ncbi:MAG: 1-acyl-sn-glycerol-3-phosphate acyltransferase, partial [Kiritimatiellia bacterium]
MSDPPVESLYHSNILDVSAMRWTHWVLLIVWAPLGLVLMLVRASLMILASVVAPPLYRAWWITTFSGTFLRVRDRMKIRDHGVVVVSNHMSYLDGVSVAAAVRSRVPLAV